MRQLRIVVDLDGPSFRAVDGGLVPADRESAIAADLLRDAAARLAELGTVPAAAETLRLQSPDGTIIAAIGVFIDAPQA